MKEMARQQRGVTLVGLLTTGILIIFIAIGLMKVVPVYVQDRTIQNILSTVAHDPDMQAAQPRDLRDSFYKRAVTMNNITVVSPDDLNIVKAPGGWVLSVTYQVKVPLVGNVSLLFDFETSSTR